MGNRLRTYAACLNCASKFSRALVARSSTDVTTNGCPGVDGCTTSPSCMAEGFICRLCRNGNLRLNGQQMAYVVVCSLLKLCVKVFQRLGCRIQHRHYDERVPRCRRIVKPEAFGQRLPHIHLEDCMADESSGFSTSISAFSFKTSGYTVDDDGVLSVDNSNVTTCRGRRIGRISSISWQCLLRISRVLASAAFTNERSYRTATTGQLTETKLKIYTQATVTSK